MAGLEHSDAVLDGYVPAIHVFRIVNQKTGRWLGQAGHGEETHVLTKTSLHWRSPPFSLTAALRILRTTPIARSKSSCRFRPAAAPTR